MNILFIRNGSYEGSGDLIKFTEALKDTGHNLYFITRERSDDNLEVVSKEVKKNATVFSISIKTSTTNLLSKFLPVIKFLKKAKSLSKEVIKMYNIDIIHAFDLEAGYIARVLSEKYNIEYNYHILDFYVDSRPIPTNIVRKFLRNLEYDVINKSINTIICTDERKKQILGSAPNNLITIHNVPLIPTELIIRNKIYDIGEKIKICYIGTLSTSRFLVELINVVGQLDWCELTIGGRGEFAKEIEMRSKNYSNVKYLGEVKYENTFKYYSQCNLMIACYDPKVLNHKYSAPNKIYEAINLGKPIIITEGTGNDAMILSEDIGYLIKYEEKSLFELLDWLKNNKNDMLEKHFNTYEALPKFNWDSTKKEIKQLYL